MSTGDQFTPGSFGYHEALHMASFLANAVDEELVCHPAIRADEDALRLATAACDALGDLYQHLGTQHGRAS